ncbi:hypothetical protein [Saccharothrix syringae]|uniref:SMODS and SLOG-associating 2TM effector domain-containing protein n=1 Tax=Saccharothrix syringae TaxID=103733 RepID=A0A5Q0H8B8_SACSY|nr:hypothetical protein [Saccharothrix syringae]QFZ22155.1 hypothetical protein EKG83_36335 [Saccharothrix syringae]
MTTEETEENGGRRSSGGRRTSGERRSSKRNSSGQSAPDQSAPDQSASDQPVSDQPVSEGRPDSGDRPVAGSRSVSGEKPVSGGSRPSAGIRPSAVPHRSAADDRSADDRSDADHRSDDHREQFLRAYLRHRVGDRLAAFERARTRYTTARRWTTAGTVLLFTAAAALGAVAVADGQRRALWAFLATATSALAVAVAAYEAAFAFRALSRRSANGVALLHLLQAHGAPRGEDGVDAFRTEVESVLRHSG